MSIRMTGLAALLAALVMAIGAESKADYLLTDTGVNPASKTFGQTTFGFTSALPPAGSSASAPSNFNVVNVSASSTRVTGADTGTTTLLDTFTVTGATGTESFTLTGTFNLVSGNIGGIVSTYSGTITNTSGSGYSISYAGYAPPSIDSNGNPTSQGNISLTIIPNTVPEPTAFALMGVGLFCAGGLAIRRRFAK